MAVAKYLELAVILKAVDQMSGTVRSALGGASAGYSQLANSHEKAQLSMQRGLTMGAGALVAIETLKGLADKYGEVDAAQRQLRISEMKPGGVIDSAAFGHQIKLVEALSRAYGEHQSAYVDMIRVMKNYHLDDKDILGGTGKSVALLSKLFETDPQAGALFASRMKTDFRVLPSEMSKMVDMAVRLKQLNSGLSGTEMLKNITDFSAGIALSAQNLGLHGAKDASELQVLGAMYTSKGIDAPQVATTLRRIFENITKPDRLKKMDEAAAKYGRHLHFFDNKGNFEGIDNFVAQLGTLKNLKPAAVQEILGVLGSAQGMSSVMLKNIAKFGTDDFRDFNRNYANQGTPDQKLAEMMGGQDEQFKKVTTDLENLQIELGKRYNPAVKTGTHLTQDFFNVLTDFASKHTTTTTIAGSLAAIAAGGMLIGSAFHFMGAAWTYSGMAGIFSWIAGLDVWGAIVIGAETFAYTLLTTVLPAIAEVAVAIGGLGALGVTAFAAPLAYLGYKMYSEHQADNKANEVADANNKKWALEDIARRADEKAHPEWFVPKSSYKAPTINAASAQIHPDITPQLKSDLGHKQVPIQSKASIVYSPTIHINTSTPVTKKTISDVLDDHSNKLLDIINKQHNDHLRTTYK